MTGFYMKGNAELNWVKSGVYVSINMQCPPAYMGYENSYLWSRLLSNKKEYQNIIQKPSIN